MSFKAWIGYSEPNQDSYEQMDCFEIGTQNLSASQVEIVKEVAGFVCKVILSQEFRNTIASSSFRASCSDTDLMSGDRLNEVLEGLPKRFSLYFSKPFRATGQTHRDKSRIAIHKNRISKWKSGDKEALISTFSHELTHLISSSFSDDGWSTPPCSKGQLVSYEVGRIVAEIALNE